jgi:hypothetical protein
MTLDPDDRDEVGAEVRICASCGHAEDEHSVITEEAERGRSEICLTCSDHHAFAPLVEIGER